MKVKDTLEYALSIDHAFAAAFAGETVDDVWAAVEARRAGGNQPIETDVRGPEWTALTGGSGGQISMHFEAEPIAAPSAFASRSAA